MTTETPFEDCSTEEQLRRLSAALARDTEQHQTEGPPRTGRAHSERTKRKLSDQMFERHRAKALLDGPTTIQRLRLDAGLSQQAAADRALIDKITWRHCEQDPESVSEATKRRVARALGVSVEELG